MWNDSEIDIEELEARLYGQIHHPATEDIQLPLSDVPSNTMPSDSSPMRIRNRYYEDKERLPPYGPRNIHHVYRKPINDGAPYFQANSNFELNGTKVNPHHADLNFHNSTNFYQRMGLLTLPEFVLNPAVNNIVVLPTPPTQIFTQQQPAQQILLREKKRLRNRNRRRARRERAKEKSKFAKQNVVKVFKEHRLTRSVEKIDLKNGNNSDSCNFSKSSVEIICLSETDNSDCELAEAPGPAVLVLSSDNETDLKISAIAEIKNETIRKVENYVRDLKVLRKEDDVLTCKSLEVNSEKTDNNNFNVSSSKTQTDVKPCEDDEDVVLIESGQNEVIIIDESQPLFETDTDVDVLNTSVTSKEGKASPTLLNKQRTDLLGTPESTNDFLDNNLKLPRNNFDVDVDDNDISCLSVEKSCVEIFESESSCSASDCEVQPKSAVFVEQDFDVPSKGTFSELNLNTFTNYIASKGNTSSIPSILTPSRKRVSEILGATIKSNKRGTDRLRSTSDSSSESDYDNDKITLVEDRTKSKQKTTCSSMSSTSDDCIIDDDGNVESNRTILPNLSPITSDEETNPTSGSRENNNKKKQKKRKIKSENAQIGKAKPKPLQQVEVVRTTNMKPSEAEINQIQQRQGTKQRRNIINSDDFFPSSSDELSEIELVQEDVESPHRSKNNRFDIELLNIEETSTPTTQSPQSSKRKPKRFSEYWSEDMKKFYCESWGHENFTVEEEQKTMSDDPSMWNIIAADRINVHLTPKGPRCRRCREFGHKALNCRKKIGPPKCILCGACGHYDSRCPNQVCTSCGRRSHYSTTYCSRCANSRHVVCKICSRRGHTSSYCTDLWRRYHLTTKGGLLERPNNFNLKPPNDRWCSGCASRGHFEYNCNYYNRTHAPADVGVYSYDDIYGSTTDSLHNATERRREAPREERGRNEDDCYNQNATRIQPWLFGCAPSSQYTYGYEQRFAQNFVQNYPPNPNLYPQFSVYQSVPNMYNLNNMNNFFNPNTNTRSVEDFRSNKYIPNDDNIFPTTSRHIPPRGDEFSFTKSLPNDEKFNTKPSLLDENLSGKKEKRHFLKLKGTGASKLLAQKGVEFLRKLGINMHLKIKVIQRKKNKQTNYLCVLEGSNELLISDAKKAIADYCTPQFNALDVFKGQEFDVNVLRKSITRLGNSAMNWVKVTRNLFLKTKKLEGELKIAKEKSELQTISKLEKKVKIRYLTLNTILLGKLDVEESAKHMKLLKQWMQGENTKKNDCEKVKESYNYVFKNCNRLNVNYMRLISKLPHNQAKCVASAKPR